MIKLTTNKLVAVKKNGVKKIEFDKGFVTVEFEEGGEMELKVKSQK